MDYPQTLKPSTSSDPHHFPKTILVGLGAFLIIIIGVGIGYFLGVNNQVNPEQNANQLTYPSPTPTPLSLPTVYPSVTANWKMYTNTTYQFHFKYPSHFVIEDNSVKSPPFSIFVWDKSVEVAYEGGSKINPYLYVDVESEKMSLQSYLSKYPNLIKQETKTFNGIQFTIVEVTQGMSQPLLYLIEKNNRIISLANGYLEQNVFDQILSTLKFTD